MCFSPIQCFTKPRRWTGQSFVLPRQAWCQFAAPERREAWLGRGEAEPVTCFGVQTTSDASSDCATTSLFFPLGLRNTCPMSDLVLLQISRSIHVYIRHRLTVTWLVTSHHWSLIRSHRAVVLVLSQFQLHHHEGVQCFRYHNLGTGLVRSCVIDLYRRIAYLLKWSLLGTGMNEIIPNLYLGSLRDATDVEQLKKNRIQVSRL